MDDVYNGMTKGELRNGKKLYNLSVKGEAAGSVHTSFNNNLWNHQICFHWYRAPRIMTRDKRLDDESKINGLCSSSAVHLAGVHEVKWKKSIFFFFY